MQKTQKKKIIIIDDQLSLSQGYAYNIAERLKEEFGLKFDIMHPRSGDGDIYLFLNHEEADGWLLHHSRECAVILSANTIFGQRFTGAEWIALKLKGPFSEVPMILMGDYYINGAGAQLIKEGFPQDRIVSKMKHEDIYAAVESAYRHAMASPAVGGVAVAPKEQTASAR